MSRLGEVEGHGLIDVMTPYNGLCEALKWNAVDCMTSCHHDGFNKHCFPGGKISWYPLALVVPQYDCAKAGDNPQRLVVY